MNLPFFIARRYLFARKSHNVINIISAISAVGMAIGTAALIIVLSVYNGFDSLVRQSLSETAPDLKVVPVIGKSFVPDSSIFAWVYDRDEVFNMSSVIEENVFISYDQQQCVAKAKGVDAVYEEESPIADHVTAGQFLLRRGQVPLCAMGAGVAYSLGANPAFLTKARIHFPIRDQAISLSNPAASIKSVDIKPSCIFSINSEIDASLVILPLETMRELMGYKDEVSAIEIRLRSGLSQKAAKSFRSELQSRLGDGFKVSTRIEQNAALYKMMRYEKLAIYMILIFVVLVIAFNIFSSLSMLIIEKKGDIETLRSLGAPEAMTRRIFRLEGWLISLLGLGIGLVAGIGFVLLQQHFGLIRMPGNYIVHAYPVILKASDLLWTVVGVAAVGYFIAILPSLMKTNSSDI